MASNDTENMSNIAPVVSKNAKCHVAECASHRATQCMHGSIAAEIQLNNNNNNNSYSAIPRKNLQARGAVHYQHQNPLDNQQTKNKKVQVL